MELIESVHENILDRIQERIDQLSPARSTLSLTHSELREMPGAIHIDEKEGQTPEQEITLLEDVEKPHLEQRAKEAEEQGKNKRAQVLRNVVDTIQLKADYIRLKNNQQPASEEVQSILEDEVNTSDLTRFERFKKWARENLLALSTVAIAAAGVITTIIVLVGKL